MTFTTTQDIARAAAPTSGIMKTPDHLEALITKDLKPFGWRKAIEQVRNLENIAEREQRRRDKLAKVERLMKNNDTVALHYLSPLRAHRMVQIFCRVTGCKHKVLMSKTKTTMICKWRHIIIWILRKNTGQSCYQIGSVLGGRDHSTVLYGFNRIERTPSLMAEALEIENAVLSFEHDTYGQEKGLSL